MSAHIYQIVWNEAQKAALEPGYLALDNTRNERPDWYEYWPIRQFWLAPESEHARALAEGELDQTYFGFFSSKFASKTLLSFAQVQAHMAQAVAANADVAVFSPQPDMAAFYLNVFEQQDAFEAGSLQLSEQFLSAAGRPYPLRTLVMDSKTTVFSNYFVAKGWFWREWLALAEQLFAMAEQPQTDWQRSLSAPTRYPNGAQAKVFLMERLAPFLLATMPQKPRVHAADPWTMGWSMSRLREFPAEAAMADALKTAMREKGWPLYAAAYDKLRSSLKLRLQAQQAQQA